MWTQGVLPPNTVWTMCVLVTGSLSLPPGHHHQHQHRLLCEGEGGGLGPGSYADCVPRLGTGRTPSIDLIENTMFGVSCNYPAQPG